MAPVLVTLPAEIDIANARDVRYQITVAGLMPGVIIVTADLTATTFCDCHGTRALMQAPRRAAAHGAELCLLRPCPHVMRVLNGLGSTRCWRSTILRTP